MMAPMSATLDVTAQDDAWRRRFFDDVLAHHGADDLLSHDVWLGTAAAPLNLREKLGVVGLGTRASARMWWRSSPT